MPRFLAGVEQTAVADQGTPDQRRKPGLPSAPNSNSIASCAASAALGPATLLGGLFRAGRRAFASAGITRGAAPMATRVVVATRLRLVAARVTLAGAGRSAFIAARVVAWVALAEGREARRDGLQFAFGRVAATGAALGRARWRATVRRAADSGRALARLTRGCGAGDHAACREQQPIFQRLERGHRTQRPSRLMRVAAGVASAQ
jgi:hypothetical protein